MPTAAPAVVSPATAVAAAPTTTEASSLLPPTTTPSPSPTLSPTNTPSPTVTPPPSPTATPTLTPTATATLTPTATAVSPLPTLTLTPNQPQSYLDKFRLVAYYGSPTGPGLGILGDQPRPATLRLLRDTVAAYQALAPERPILATYHMVVSVAKPNPPYYYASVDLALVEEWVNAAEEEGVAVILDIQPGQGDVFYIYQRFRHLLYRPHVHLAIDPEFTMGPNQIPAQTVGSLYAGTINQIQADLNQIALEIGLNRVLILHQFAEVMLPDKENITDYPHVEIVIDGDGVGSPAAKIRNYNQYAEEPAFEYGGFKLFPTDGDYPVLTPGEVMSVLQPAPVLIIYQ